MATGEEEDGGSMTFAMFKPDAVKRGLVGKLREAVKEAGFVIEADIAGQFTAAQAGEFYANIKDSPYYDPVIAFMTSGPIVALALRLPASSSPSSSLEAAGGLPAAISKWRAVIGPTWPPTAREKAPTSLRALYGSDTAGANCVHGSDSPLAVVKEIDFWMTITGLAANHSSVEGPAGEEGGPALGLERNTAAHWRRAKELALRQCPKPTLVLISGKRRAGKDTVAQVLAGSLAAVRVGISDRVKYLFAQRNGLDYQRLLSDREYKDLHRSGLVDFYKSHIESVDRELPLVSLIEESRQLFAQRLGHVTHVLTPDLRHVADLQFFLDSPTARAFFSRVVTLRVNADDEVRKQRGWQPSEIDFSPVECELDSYSAWHAVFDNDFASVAELETKLLSDLLPQL